jgi:hypothetical protein
MVILGRFGAEAFNRNGAEAQSARKPRGSSENRSLCVLASLRLCVVDV